MKYQATVLLLAITSIAFAQQKMRDDHSIPIPKLTFDANGELVIKPSATSSSTDFDFLVGKWKVGHEKLKERLVNNNQWEEYETTQECFRILEGLGNMDVANAVLDGKPWEGRTIRLFNPKTNLWSLYWVSSNTGVMDPPVIGSFENDIGHFFTKDTFKGKPIIMMFRWDKRDKENSIWSQAFSLDHGKTWEWNWYTSHRAK